MEKKKIKHFLTDFPSPFILLPGCAGWSPSRCVSAPECPAAGCTPPPTSASRGAPRSRDGGGCGEVGWDGPPRSRPRCPSQTTDPSGRQTDLGLRVVPYGHGAAESLSCPGSHRSPEPRPRPRRRQVSGRRPRSVTGVRELVSRRAWRHRSLRSSRGRCPPRPADPPSERAGPSGVSGAPESGAGVPQPARCPHGRWERRDCGGGAGRRPCRSRGQSRARSPGARAEGGSRDAWNA